MEKNNQRSRMIDIKKRIIMIIIIIKSSNSSGSSSSPKDTRTRSIFLWLRKAQ